MSQNAGNIPAALGMPVESDASGGGSHFRPWALEFLLTAVVLLLLTVPFWLMDLDLMVSGYFYVPDQGWIYADHPWVRLLYEAGPWPGILAASLAGIVYLGTLWKSGRQTRLIRKITLFHVLLLGLGPGLLINGIFKDHWGRPRPQQITAFSGQEEYVPVWHKGHVSGGKSFPSGHASMGFYLIAPYFLLRRRFQKQAKIFLLLGLSAGALIGLGRIMQGAHFLSDVLWSGGMVYLSGVVVLQVMEFASRRNAMSAPSKLTEMSAT